MTARVTRKQIIAAARDWIGTPYMHQASLKRVGCDCVGLLRGIWRDFYGEEPEKMLPYTPQWADVGEEELLLGVAKRRLDEKETRNIEEGDVLLFRWSPNALVKHVALATSETCMIHAHDGVCVSEVPITFSWRRKISHVFSFRGIKD